MRNPGYIYTMSCEEVRKIGLATDPRGRLSSHRTSNPFITDYHYWLVGDDYRDTVAEERNLHETYSTDNVYREWFYLPDSRYKQLHDYMCENYGAGFGDFDLYDGVDNLYISEKIKREIKTRAEMVKLNRRYDEFWEEPLTQEWFWDRLQHKDMLIDFWRGRCYGLEGVDYNPRPEPFKGNPFDDFTFPEMS